MNAPRRLIVDGYNVIRSTPPYRELAEVDMDSARAALVSDVASYSGGDMQTIVVFDGAANPMSDGAVHTTAGVQVIFSKYGMDADTVIERLTRDARAQGEEVHVVTSDAQTQWTVLGHSVRRRSAADFSDDLAEDRTQWQQHTGTGGRSSPIEERIDPEVRSVLERWARGGE